ncbi:hypothetical protein MTR67_038281 [Solanum verrucosum]|uniref:Uncharacterized protein n=1 Tax=Solanum verrucosum TaxID=315347 RepID=A0AAF0ZMR8_SOLVR|nr:hypothetical protein MTR67_038281 [Solanum verrucosum]
MHLHDQLKAELEDHKRRISQCVDIEEGQRQLIIERATLRHQLEAAEKREALLRNNLGDHQVWLNYCYENMRKARRQVHQLAEQTFYVIKNHRRMNDPAVAEQARAIVPHLLKVPISYPFFPPGYGPFDNCGAGPSTIRPQGMPFRNNPTVATAAPVYTLPQLTVTQRAPQEGQFIVHPEQYYTPGIAFGGPNSVQFGSPIDVVRPLQISKQEEMLKKMKSIEQHMKSMQGIGGNKSVAFKDLCMFPNVHLPPGFKTPKFDKYDGHGDQLRGAGGKEELLMAYLGESLTGVASEWFIDQEISHWHIWDDMAQDFVR